MTPKLTKIQAEILSNDKLQVTANGRSIGGKTFSMMCSLVVEAVKRYPFCCKVRLLRPQGIGTTQDLLRLLEHSGFNVTVKDGVICGAVSCQSLQDQLCFRLEAV